MGPGMMGSGRDWAMAFGLFAALCFGAGMLAMKGCDVARPHIHVEWR